VNLFPNKSPIPKTLLEVNERVQNLQFANKTFEDLKMLGRIDEVVELMAALENLPGGNPLKDNPAYEAVAKRGYVRVPRIISITPPQQVGGFDGSDFSPESIQMRADEGYAQTQKALNA
jgi:NTE family protein